VSHTPHERIETLAGAIALGEAAEGQRLEYREHIASCPDCLRALGGERELERTAETVATARQSEVWEPDLRDAIARRIRRGSRLVRLAFSFLAVCLGVAFATHILIVSGIARLTPTLAAPLVINAGGARIVLERSSTPALKPAPQPQRMVVTHNVVQIVRAPVSIPPANASRAPKPYATPAEIAAVTVHPEPPATSGVQKDVPIWRRSSQSAAWQTVAKTTTTSLTVSAPQAAINASQPIRIAAAYTTREAAPVGGETAINPQPPAIAYDENAEGTTVFQVMIDERGMPTKCIITKPAGYPVLDDAVCRAAMKARYVPKTVDGRAVPGIYRDAFTFHMTENNAVEGVPRPIQ